LQQEGMGAKRRSQGWISIPAWKIYATSTERTLRKSYQGSSGLASFSSGFLEGRVPANKEIHELGSIGGVHEFVLVLWS
jgi:hypothetical protein